MLHEQILRIVQRPAGGVKQRPRAVPVPLPDRDLGQCEIDKSTEISVSNHLGDLDAINPAQKSFRFIEAQHLN